MASSNEPKRLRSDDDDDDGDDVMMMMRDACHVGMEVRGRYQEPKRPG